MTRGSGCRCCDRSLPSLSDGKSRQPELLLHKNRPAWFVLSPTSVRSFLYLSLCLYFLPCREIDGAAAGTLADYQELALGLHDSGKQRQKHGVCQEVLNFSRISFVGSNPSFS